MNLTTSGVTTSARAIGWIVTLLLFVIGWRGRRQLDARRVAAWQKIVEMAASDQPTSLFARAGGGLGQAWLPSMTRPSLSDARPKLARRSDIFSIF